MYCDPLSVSLHVCLSYMYIQRQKIKNIFIGNKSKIFCNDSVFLSLQAINYLDKCVFFES